MKHIYLFTEGNIATKYGIGTYIEQMKNILLQLENVSLNIVYLDYIEDEFCINAENNYRIFKFPPSKSITNIKREKYLRNAWYILNEYIVIDKSDQLLFHLNSSIEYSIILLMKEKFPDCKIILTIHYLDCPFPLKFNSYFPKETNLHNKEDSSKEEKGLSVLFAKEKKLYKSVDHIISLSKYTTQYLINNLDIPSSKITLINNGLKDKGIQLSFKDIKHLKSSYFFKKTDKTILFVGRLEESKGLDILINAFKNVVQQYNNCHLIIVGEGDHQKYHKECISYWGKITFTGHLNKPDLYKLYQIADLGVLPSYNEQCSYVAIEMMMFDIPLIISTSTGLNEMIEGVDKLVIQDSHEKIDITIRELTMLIIDHLKKKRKKGFYRDIYDQKYSLQEMTNKIKQLYFNL